jgi:hypothetical protein
MVAVVAGGMLVVDQVGCELTDLDVASNANAWP